MIAYATFRVDLTDIEGSESMEALAHRLHALLAPLAASGPHASVSLDILEHTADVPCEHCARGGEHDA